MELPSMAVRSLKRPYNQQQAQESAAPYVVTGIHALLFDDDTLAAFINSPAALLPWNGDESLLIDRYDVRHLLQDLSGIRKRRPAPPLTDVTEEELNHERYRDLQGAPGEEHQSPEEPSNSSAGGYQAVPFSYSVEATENGLQTESTHRSAGFAPPFPVPDFLLPKLTISLVCGQPPSEKLHQIMVGTAKFVKEHGGQSEVLLKVKQGNNPMFGFLNVDHHLHEYYRYLVQHPEVLQSSARPAEVTRSTGEGLSLLGFAYGSGDDDDVGALRSANSQGDAAPVTLGAGLGLREGLINSDGGLPDVDECGIAAQGKPVVAASHLPKTGEETQPKVPVIASRALSQLYKRKKVLAGSKELIQPNKKIVSQFNISDAPRKDAPDTSNRLPRKLESKTSSWHSVPTSKDLDYGMSADAAAAAVFAATRGARGLKQDSSNNKSSSSSGLSQKVLDANRQYIASGGSKGSISFGLGQSDVRLAKAVAEAAAIAASHEADSADVLLTPVEKLKAERLRKAKMFAAMIKSGKCAAESDAKPAGQLLGTLPAATSTKSDDMRADSFPGLSVIGKSIVNGKSISTEEVEDSEISKRMRSEITNITSKQVPKDRIYRKHEREEEHMSRSDSDAGEHRRKRRAHEDNGVHKKHRRSKRKKHKASDSESADSGCSSGNESKDRHRSKSRHRHHQRRKRSHHEKEDSRDGKHDQARHRTHDDDSHSDLSNENYRHRKYSISEEDAPGSSKVDLEDKSLKAASGEERLLSPAHLKHSYVSDDRTKPAVTTEVPAEIRAKVRAMLLATL